MDRQMCMDSTGRVCYIDMEGNPQKISCSEDPYGYSDFCLYKTANWEPTQQSFYSDRLYSWYPDKYEKLKKKYLGTSDYFSSYKPEQIERFCSALFGYKIHITGISEYCNASNGYPYWRIYYIKD